MTLLCILQNYYSCTMAIYRLYVTTCCYSCYSCYRFRGKATRFADVHKLNILEGATFRKKIPLRSYNPNQQAYVSARVNEMLKAGIIHPIHPSKVQFIVQMVLVQKTHNGQGLSIEELKHKVNNQCLKHNLPGKFKTPALPEQVANPSIPENTPIKWRMCQDFKGINRVTKVAPIPQGDICAKQLRLSGH